ncbi:MAG: tryptophan synthase subunit alpha [Anaerolineales bacterium]|jgi:tryptophan synthase alpha chain
MQGIEHIQNVFAGTRRQGRAALMPYFTLGFPTPDSSLETVRQISRNGADLIELGVPYSDPLADGPTIQHSTQVALQQGMHMADCLAQVKQLRRDGVEQPFLMMGYYNPMLAYGLERCVADTAKAGADGFIVPDLPYEEAGELAGHCRDNGLALVAFVAPTTPDKRLVEIVQAASGFLYLVSLTGVTGARDKLSTGLKPFIERVRAKSDLPLAVGFGISTPAQARQVGAMADGVIVGSALIRAAAESPQPAKAAAEFVAALRQGLEDGRAVGDEIALGENAQ